MSFSAPPLDNVSESLEDQSLQSSVFDETGFLSTLTPEPFSYPECDAAWNTYLDWDLPGLAYQDSCLAEVPDGQPDWYTHGLANSDQRTPQKAQWSTVTDASTQSRSSTEPTLAATSVRSSDSTILATPATNFNDSNYFPEPATLGDDFLPIDFSSSSGDLNSFADMGFTKRNTQGWPEISAINVPNSSIKLEYEHPKVQPKSFTAAPKALPAAQIFPSQLPEPLSSTEISKKRKLAHSVIEKNYRSRISTGMAELRECVPLTLETGDALLHQSSGKVSVLANAVKYMKNLELENQSLSDKMDILQRRNDLLQKIALSKISMNTPASSETIRGFAQEDEQTAPKPFSDLKARKRIKKSPLVALDGSQSPLASRGHRPSDGFPKLRKKYGSVTKLAMGSLAAIAVVEGNAENDSHGKMLFALPTEVINKGWQIAASGIRTISFRHDSPAFITLLKVLLILTIILQVLVPLFQMQSVAKEEDLKSSSIRTASSPHEGRRDAWLTSIQSVSVPSRHLHMELGALSLKICKVVLRKLFGWQTYARLTGASGEDEKVRIKAWDIAIDAQLAGGDPEICGNRLIFTFLASITLPDTPARLMLRALHVQVINAFVHRKEYLRWLGSDRIAHGVSQYYWNKARLMQKNHGLHSAYAVDVASDPLPPCYATLLTQSSREVFSTAITTRAYCLALKEPLDRMDVICDEGIDTVIDDMEIRSPIQALAAWWSSLCLRRALIETLNAINTTHDTSSAIYKDISLALASAPRGSVAETRALASRAIFCAIDREKSIDAALQILPITPIHPTTTPHAPLTLNLLLPSISHICTTSVRISLRAAMLLSRLHIQTPPVNRTTARLLASLSTALDADDVSLLGFAAAYQCLRECAENATPLAAMPTEIQGLAVRLRALIGSAWSSWSEGHGVPERTVDACVRVCESLLST